MSLSITHINFGDSQGGAAEVMQNLVRKQKFAGMEISVFCSRPSRTDSYLLGFGINNKASLPLKILQKMSAIRNRVFADTDGVCDRIYFNQLTKAIPDIYHVHNIHGGWFSLGLLPLLAKKAPVIWTLHDEWAITGHCVATFGCEKWRTGCGDCPHLDTMVSVWRDNTAANWLKRKQIYSQLYDSKANLVTVSEWLGRRLSESSIWQGATVAIPNGIDTNVFYPSDKEDARNVLGIDVSSKVVLCGAVGGTDNPFKNTRLIFDILDYLQTNQKITIISIGNSIKINNNNSMVEFLTPGHITDRELLRKYYVAADLVFYPTKADSFGLIVAEAMACATPVMASAVGGVCEIIEHDRNGFLFDVDESAKDIAQKINLVLEDKNKLKYVSEKAHLTIKDKFTLDIQEKKYVDLYTSLITEKHNKCVRV